MPILVLERQRNHRLPQMETQTQEKEPVIKEKDEVRESTKYYNTILGLAGEAEDEFSIHGETGRTPSVLQRAIERKRPPETDSDESKKKRAKKGDSKLRTPVSHMGDVFIRKIGLERKDITHPISQDQMLLYLLWRNLYWTRFYGTAAHANAPVSLKHCDAVGVMAPFKRLIEYLELMFVKVAPFLPSTPPSKDWVIQRVLQLARGRNRILQIHPVVHTFSGDDLKEEATELFASSPGVSIIDVHFCKRFDYALAKDVYGSVAAKPFSCNPGIFMLHDRWFFAEINPLI